MDEVWADILRSAPPGATSTGLSNLVAGLAPLMLLTAALAAGLAFVGGDDLLASIAISAFALNDSGSAGDILRMRKVMSYPRATRFEDTGDGFVAYGPVGDPESP